MPFVSYPAAVRDIKYSFSGCAGHLVRHVWRSCLVMMPTISCEPSLTTSSCRRPSLMKVCCHNPRAHKIGQTKNLNPTITAKHTFMANSKPGRLKSRCDKHFQRVAAGLASSSHRDTAGLAVTYILECALRDQQKYWKGYKSVGRKCALRDQQKYVYQYASV